MAASDQLVAATVSFWPSFVHLSCRKSVDALQVACSAWVDVVDVVQVAGSVWVDVVDVVDVVDIVQVACSVRVDVERGIS